MYLDCSAITDIGRIRKSNQDSVGCFPDLHLYLVADGMGGLRFGELASRLAVEAIHDQFQGAGESLNGERAALLTSAIHKANQRIRDEAPQEGTRGDAPALGTTVVALCVSPGSRTATWAHVGDSRLYRARGTRVELLTADHTVPGAAYRDQSTIPLDLPHTNQLVQALGTMDEIEPSQGSCEIVDGDVFLLCTDGVSGMVSPSELEAQLVSARAANQIARRLIDLALEAEGRDNASVVVVKAIEGEE